MFKDMEYRVYGFFLFLSFESSVMNGWIQNKSMVCFSSLLSKSFLGNLRTMLGGSFWKGVVITWTLGEKDTVEVGIGKRTIMMLVGFVLLLEIVT